MEFISTLAEKILSWELSDNYNKFTVGIEHVLARRTGSNQLAPGVALKLVSEELPLPAQDCDRGVGRGQWQFACEALLEYRCTVDPNRPANGRDDQVC